MNETAIVTAILNHLEDGEIIFDGEAWDMELTPSPHELVLRSQEIPALGQGPRMLSIALRATITEI